MPRQCDTPGVDANDAMVQDHAPIPNQTEGTTTQMNPSSGSPSGVHIPSHHRVVIEEFPGAAQTFGTGRTFIDQFNMDQYSAERITNLYYPFASKAEWELASFLLQSKMSMAAIDAFLSLELIRRIGLSFRTAKDLRSRAEMLPKGPQWKCRTLHTAHPTKYPVHLFYRDPIECLQSLLSNPIFKNHIQFTPLRVFQLAQEQMRVYSEWWTGDAAWTMQEQLPPGASLLGTILSSDKTNISAMTGGRVAHPLLISLANISMDLRMRASSHAFLLLALLPIPKFIHKNKKLCGMLENCLIHECLDTITQPLKKAAEIGMMMTDPLGYRHYCFTPLAAYIVDTPEAAMLAGVAGRTSPVTLASYTQFGDNFRHEPRMLANTVESLRKIELESRINPWDLELYTKEAMKYRLNGVHWPFFHDWPMSEPSVFLTPEPLHHWHKFLWDHDVKWCCNVLGDAEIDFRFSILHPHTGFRHFTEGISKLKQVTGREHRDVQHYLVPVIAGAVPKHLLIAIRALMDFRYLAQARIIDDRVCIMIQTSLKEFHDHKAAILAAGARRGKGSKIIDNWYIPKLEFLQSVVPSIRSNGSPIQWSADVTERTHISEIKDPTRASNNQRYEEQICRYLDRAEKCQQFNLATSMLEGAIPQSTTCPTPNDDDNESDSETEFGDDCATTNIAKKFQIPDLGVALLKYFQQTLPHNQRQIANDPLQVPFDRLEVWINFRIQSRAYHTPHEVLPPQTINASPPSSSWPVGRCDAVLINNDPTIQWPYSGIKGHSVAQIRIIMHPILKPGFRSHPSLDKFLAYVQHFDIVPQTTRAFPGTRTSRGRFPEPSTGLYVLKRAKHANKVAKGSVICLDTVRAHIELTPWFGDKANPHLTKQTSAGYSSEFWLDKYFDKELFYALSLSSSCN
ncbi:hypothetical protein BD779DRAFT_1481169 [Infundibulicybe gibba]|nr:hypothetical protein BD779DRAFT_1481169 [Infundibulicybe gibba]